MDVSNLSWIFCYYDWRFCWFSTREMPVHRYMVQNARYWLCRNTNYGKIRTILKCQLPTYQKPPPELLQTNCTYINTFAADDITFRLVALCASCCGSGPWQIRTSDESHPSGTSCPAINSSHHRQQKYTEFWWHHQPFDWFTSFLFHHNVPSFCTRPLSSCLSGTGGQNKLC